MTHTIASGSMMMTATQFTQRFRMERRHGEAELPTGRGLLDALISDPLV